MPALMKSSHSVDDVWATPVRRLLPLAIVLYHAWTELRLGAWVTADAVFRQLPADATHVKLIEGGPERHLELAGIVGELAFTAEESAL